MKWLPVVFIVLLSCAGSNHPKFIALGQSFTNRIENRQNLEAPVKLVVDVKDFSSYQGNLSHLITKEPIKGARITLHSDKIDRPVTTDVNGNFTFLIDELVTGFTIEVDDLPDVRMNFPPDFWDWYKEQVK